MSTSLHNDHAPKSYDIKKVIEQLNMVIEDSEKMSKEVMGHLEVILDKLDELEHSKNLQSDIDGIKNNIFNTMSSMQAQDFHVQRIQRVVNNIDPSICSKTSAKYIAGDEGDDILNEEDIEALIAQMTNGQ